MLKIIWSEFAESQLDNIYIYYKENADINVAKKLLKGIINEPNKLINSQEIGQKEQFLMHREIEYRYLIYKNYKIIYNIDFINETIKISDVFDTRQNPIKKIEQNKFNYTFVLNIQTPKNEKNPYYWSR